MGEKGRNGAELEKMREKMGRNGVEMGQNWGKIGAGWGEVAQLQWLLQACRGRCSENATGTK